MSRVRSAEDLVFDVRQRLMLENSDMVTDSEILEYLNQELAELRSRLRRNEGQVHDRKTIPLSVVAGTSSYDLAAIAPDFWELLGIEANIGGLTRRLEPFMENERASLGNSLVTGTLASPMYRLMGASTLEILPSSLTFTALIKYVPSQPRLVLGQIPPQTVEGFNGYEIAAVYGACATCQEKEQLDPSFYSNQKERIYRLIEANAAQRDAGSPERVTDVTGGLDYDIFSPYGGWR